MNPEKTGNDGLDRPGMESFWLKKSKFLHPMAQGVPNDAQKLISFDLVLSAITLSA